jgi:hypothetical protein
MVQHKWICMVSNGELDTVWQQILTFLRNISESSVVINQKIHVFGYKHLIICVAHSTYFVPYWAVVDQYQ